ncbi:MAG: FeoA domain protein [Candidatus Methanolliviera sp. GoM_asphalt]|nr:MAG: FeoA domain protein [Candidatus Methanolliviera sp. GoM_asphalt]
MKEIISLNDVEPETTMIVERIEGDIVVKTNLNMVGIFEGVELTVVDTMAPLQKRELYVTTKIGEELVTIGRGLAGKILVS